MLSALFTSTLTQQAITFDVVSAESNHPNDTANIDRATVFSVYNGNDLAISELRLECCSTPSFSLPCRHADNLPTS